MSLTNLNLFQVGHFLFSVKNKLVLLDADSYHFAQAGIRVNFVQIVYHRVKQVRPPTHSQVSFVHFVQIRVIRNPAVSNSL